RALRQARARRDEPPLPARRAGGPGLPGGRRARLPRGDSRRVVHLSAESPAADVAAAAPGGWGRRVSRPRTPAPRPGTVARRVDVFPRRGEGRRQRSAAQGSARAAARDRRRLPFRRRRPRRDPVSRGRAAALTALGALALLASYAPFRLPPLSFVAITPAVL